MPREEKCGTCKGNGRVHSAWNMTNDGKHCETCKGSGKIKAR